MQFVTFEEPPSSPCVNMSDGQGDYRKWTVAQWPGDTKHWPRCLTNDSLNALHLLPGEHDTPSNAFIEFARAVLEIREKSLFSKEPGETRCLRRTIIGLYEKLKSRNEKLE